MNWLFHSRLQQHCLRSGAVHHQPCTSLSQCRTYFSNTQKNKIKLFKTITCNSLLTMTFLYNGSLWNTSQYRRFIDKIWREMGVAWYTVSWVLKISSAFNKSKQIKYWWNKFREIEKEGTYVHLVNSINF